MEEVSLEGVHSLIKSGELMKLLRAHRFWTSSNIAAEIGMHTKEDRKELTGILWPLTHTDLSEDQVAERVIVEYWKKKGKTKITLDECIGVYALAKTLLREARKQQTPTMVRVDINLPR
jgi:hypothetical protein